VVGDTQTLLIKPSERVCALHRVAKEEKKKLFGRVKQKKDYKQPLHRAAKSARE
jgi:hypothetical protein